MPKHEALTPKAISNRIKSIGLQKLRWYCQMCQKQCRDENGFKCHTTSETHLRQMRLFAENPHQQIDEFSAEFERGFIEMLSYRHGTKRVLANRVYQEYIGDKHHIHMNATIWTSLTEICKYLGKEGKATVDETEKGWFIQYIDRDPRMLAKQAALDQRKVVEYDQEERTQRMIESQIAAAAEHQDRKRSEAADGNNGDDEDADAPQDLIRTEGSAKIGMSLSTNAVGGVKRPIKLVSFGSVGGAFESRSSESTQPPLKRSNFTPSSSSATPVESSSQSRAPPMSAMEQIMIEEERKKEVARQAIDKTERTDYWLQPGIVVKIKNKKVGDGKFYKMKAVVVRVIEQFVGEVSILENSTVIRIDQDHLETVLPKLGSNVMILNGYGKGKVAVLTKINESKFNCDVMFEDDKKEKRNLLGVNYEDVSKIYNGS